MLRSYLTLLLVLLMAQAYPQNDLLLFKKGRHTLATYAKGSYISFQLAGGQWMKGIITRIANDSFYLTQEIVLYNFGHNDTSHYSGFHYTLNDVYALPKPGVQIDYLDGRWQINPGGGHIHFYWIKAGWLFRVGGAGYAGLDVVNGLIRNDFSFKKEKTSLAIAAGVFLFGVVLQHTYRLTYHLGKKYRLETLKMR